MIKDLNAWKKYLVNTIKEEEKATKTLLYNGKKYKNANKLTIRSITKRELTEEEKEIHKEKATQFYNMQVEKYKALGIYSNKKQRAIYCLEHRFKKLGIYYSLLYEIYTRDNTKQDYFNLCYIVTMSRKTEELEDLRPLYRELKELLELETNVTRKRKQQQIFKEMTSYSNNNIQIEDNAQSKLLEEIEKNIDLTLLLKYLEENTTYSQYKALINYITEGKKVDTRQLKRIKSKLKTSNFKALLY